MSIPIVFFVIQPVVIAPIILGASSFDISPYLVTLGSILPGLIGGILFGIPFLMIVKALPLHWSLNDLMIIAAMGFILFIDTQSVIITNAPYPPYGLPTVLFTPLACFLIFSGLYSSAVSISGDIALRQFIRASVRDELKLLGSIGFAQSINQVESRVTQIVKEHQGSILEESGVESSVTSEDIRSYLDEVLQEVKGTKNSKGGN
jgi:hypothetical protein